MAKDAFAQTFPDIANPGDAFHKLVSKTRATVTPGSVTDPNSLMRQQGEGFHPYYRRSPFFREQLRNSLRNEQYPNAGELALATTIAGIEGYRGYKKGTREGASAADRAAGTADAISGVSSLAGSILPGWYGRLAQLAALLTSEYGREKGNEAEGRRVVNDFRDPRDYGEEPIPGAMY